MAALILTFGGKTLYAQTNPSAVRHVLTENFDVSSPIKTVNTGCVHMVRYTDFFGYYHTIVVIQAADVLTVLSDTVDVNEAETVSAYEKYWEQHMESKSKSEWQLYAISTLLLCVSLLGAYGMSRDNGAALLFQTFLTYLDLGLAVTYYERARTGV